MVVMRSLNLATSDGRPMYVIASDGGLLAEPVKVTELPILMGSVLKYWLILQMDVISILSLYLSDKWGWY